MNAKAGCANMNSPTQWCVFLGLEVREKRRAPSSVHCVRVFASAVEQLIWSWRA